MPTISLNMITQRSIEEGAAMERGKTNQDYFEACSIIELNPEDMKRAGILRSTNVRVVSECGTVIVKAKEPTQYVPPALRISARVCGRTRSCHQGPNLLERLSTADSR